MKFTSPTVLIGAVALVAASCAGSDDAAQTPPPSDPAESPAAVPTSTTTTSTSTTSASTPRSTTTTSTTTSTSTTSTTTSTVPVADLEFDHGRGDADVGVRTLTITGASGAERDLTVEVWFPLAAGASADLPRQRYTFAPGVFYESPFAFAAGAERISPDGPFPLVVYSHGSGGTRYIHSDYTETIASNGYIVVAPDHTGNTAADDLFDTRDASEVIALSRPKDVSSVIDAMLNPESPETVGFVQHVDPENIAVTGHSFGGFTSYAVVSGFENEIGSYEGDDRVDAIITLAPATGERLLSDDRLAAVDVPALAIVGTDDATTPADPNVERPWTLSASSPSYRAELVAAEHQTFTDVCAYVEFLPTLPDVPDLIIDYIADFAVAGCSPGDMPIERAQALTNTLAVTFLDSVFRGGEPLTVDDVDEQDDLVFAAKA